MATVMHYCIQELHWPPSLFLNMTAKEKAIVVASAQLRAKEMENERRKAERKAKTGRR